MAKEDNKIERRNTATLFRSADENSRHVEGYAAVFNSQSELLGSWDPFTEIIMPGAFDGVVEQSDVFALINHDNRRGVLARSKNGQGSLKLTIDEKGLKYEFDAPNTPLGDELLENLRRGEIDSSSFAFTVKEEKWTNIGTEAEPKYLRTISKVERLYDVSPVYTPAYADTTCSTRGLDAIKAEEAEELRAAAVMREIDNIYKIL